MQMSALWWLVPLLISVFIVLGWVGWRFFVCAQLPPVAWPAGIRARVARARVLRWLLLPATLAGLVVLITLQLGGYHVLGMVAPESRTGEAHIRLALAAEPLVPPPPLPPSSFLSEERPSLAGADRDWSKLEPRFARQLLAVIARMERRGYPVVLIEGYRSPERQEALAGGAVRVTHARAFQSRHQYGEAADLAPVREGRIVLSEQDPWAWRAYQALGEEAEAEGLAWGGHWSLKDYGHIEAKAQVVASTAR